MADLYLRSDDDKSNLLSLRTQEDKIPIPSPTSNIIIINETATFNTKTDDDGNIIMLEGFFNFNTEVIDE